MIDVGLYVKGILGFACMIYLLAVALGFIE